MPSVRQDQDSNYRTGGFANKGYSRMAQDHHPQDLASFPTVHPNSAHVPLHSFCSSFPQYSSESGPGVPEEAWLPQCIVYLALPLAEQHKHLKTSIFDTWPYPRLPESDSYEVGPALEYFAITLRWFCSCKATAVLEES